MLQCMCNLFYIVYFFTKQFDYYFTPTYYGIMLVYILYIKYEKY